MGARRLVREAVEIARPVADVFAAVSDHEGTPRWAEVATVALVIPGVPRNGLGAVREVRFPGRFSPTLREEVVRWDPSRGYSYAIRSGFPGLVAHLGTWELDDLGGGRTRARWEIDFEFATLHPFRPFVGPFLKNFTGVVRRSLAKLKHLQEEGPGSSLAREGGRRPEVSRWAASSVG